VLRIIIGYEGIRMCFLMRKVLLIGIYRSS
jgi:hypothetical protein